MTDILRGLTGAGWSFLVAWVLPSVVTVVLFGWAIYPAVDDLPVLDQVAGMEATQQLVVAGFVALILAVVLSQSQVLLYRLLEGYVLWPAKIRDIRIEKWRVKRAQLAQRIEQETGLKRSLSVELLGQLPERDDQIAPTKLGNAIRAFETYGQNRYHLDSQILWSELITKVPDRLASEYASARAGVDFFISTLYLSLGYGIVGVATGILSGQVRWAALGTGLGAIALTPIWWYLAVKSVGYWHSATRAVVNLGRKPLAEALGFELPGTHEAEQRMWERVVWFINYPNRDDLGTELDAYRAVADQPPAKPDASSH